MYYSESNKCPQCIENDIVTEPLGLQCDCDFEPQVPPTQLKEIREMASSSKTPVRSTPLLDLISQPSTELIKQGAEAVRPSS